MIRALLDFYILILIVDAILSYVPSMRRQIWAQKIKKVADFTCAPIRRYLPPDLPFDVSPLVVIVLIKLIQALW